MKKNSQMSSSLAVGILLALAGMTLLIFRRVSPIIVGPLAALLGCAAFYLYVAPALDPPLSAEAVAGLQLCGLPRQKAPADDRQVVRPAAPPIYRQQDVTDFPAQRGAA